MAEQLPPLVSPSRVVRVGRDPSLDIVLNDNTVSRLHLEVMEFDSGKLFVSDCSSKFGSFIERPNGEHERISQAWVDSSAVLLLGNQRVPVDAIRRASQKK